MVFTEINWISNLRKMYIETALETMNHQWLATALLPEYQVESVRINLYNRMASQIGHESKRPAPTQNSEASGNSGDENSESTEKPTLVDPTLTPEEQFYELYWELSRTSFEAYLDEHPETLDNGWENIYINEAGLKDDGTTIYTTMGEQVLAIDVPNKLLLVRVTDTGYRGVLAIGKDPAQLRCVASDGIGSYGQSLQKIVTKSEGVIGMTASGFEDKDFASNGGEVLGFAYCEGTYYGFHANKVGWKRLELSADNQMYIVDTQSQVYAGTTDAVEFSPALIIDGELMVGGFYEWNGTNPRAAIGQSERGEILMLVIEGRLAGYSIGTDVETCAQIMKRHEGYNALNLDGGASAMMYYDGEYITRCSNGSDGSRLMPNAWVYGNYE